MKKNFRPPFLFVALLAAGLLPLGCGSKNSPTSSGPGSSGSGTPSYSFSYFFGSSGMDGPVGIGFSGNLLWVMNVSNSRLQAWNPLLQTVGKTITQYGATSFFNPQELVTGPDGYVYVADSNNHQVAVFTPDGQYNTTFAAAELGGDYDSDVWVNSTNAYVVDTSASNVIKYSITNTTSGKTFTHVALTLTPAPSVYFEDIAVDASGNLYLAEGNSGFQILEYSASGAFVKAFTLPNYGEPWGTAFDSQGYLYTCDINNALVQVFSPSGGSPVTTIGGGYFVAPQAICFDSAGDLYVADAGIATNQVVVFSRN